MNTWRTSLKLKNTKKLKYKVSKDEHTTDKVKRHNEHLDNINKTDKYKKLNMSENRTDMNITKIDKYTKLNSTSTTECKANMNITEKLSSTFTKEH